MAFQLLLPMVFYYLAGLLFIPLERKWPVRKYERKEQLPGDLIAAAALFGLPFGEEAFRKLLRDHLPQAEVLPSLPPILAGAIVFVAADFLAYWMHRVIHQRWIWPVHRWHHMPDALYWLSGSRGTVLHGIFLFGAPAALLHLLGADLVPETSFWIAFGVVFNLLHNHWAHSNTDLAPRWMEPIFVTPRIHRIHHASEPRLRDRNFGFVFSLWDRMFGTYADPNVVGTEYPVGERSPHWTSQVRAFIGI